ncbi:MAG: TetR/AcrR family transcriptional regulator [Eubacteriales bacterium]
MNDIIRNIPSDKRDRILNSALEEFSRYGYNNTSTNNIVESAEISKGLLYHYFGSKDRLYSLLKEFAVELAYKDVIDSLNWNVSDIYERVKEYYKIKIKIAREYPYLFRFIDSLAYEMGERELEDYITKSSSSLYKNLLTYNIDFTKFDDEIDVRKSVNIIQWTIEKYVDKAIGDLIHFGKMDEEAIWKHIDEYIVILKQVFYKSEYR